MYDPWVIKYEREFDYPWQRICDNDSMEKSAIRNKSSNYEQSWNKRTVGTTNNTTP